MTDSPLVDRARQGDVRAIAAFIQRMLPRDVHVHVSHQGDRLHIALETFHPLQSAVLVPRLEQGLTTIHPPNIQTVRIETRQPGSASSLWHAEFPLGVPDAATVSSADLASQAKVSHPVKPKQQDLGFLLIERFNWVKVGFLTLLALHSLFSSHNYTVSGFLNSGDFVMMFLHNVNLIFHEAGHTLLIMFGQLIHLIGGSLMQIVVPLGLSLYFWLTKQPYASAIALWWTGQNFLDVSVYIKDAQERILPLLGGEGSLHDWHFILLDLRLLRYDDGIGNMAYGIGILIYIGAIALGLYYAQNLPEQTETPDSHTLQP